MGLSLGIVSRPTLLFIGTALVFLVLGRVLFHDLDHTVRHVEEFYPPQF
jgi:hypothetical protein